ncbi:MarR family transcriptional regulator [Bacillaceae bacterium SIJ1]|uniref:MarR family winged helix-turn-helix transcriptional regulator n=1 Tax=Litoribacterium kuwaitense TaxID=1398745 RepID=UPI0013EBF0D8|nr:MarR family transcriptional regulator [Litoribacterium kuwaitense]NGP43990.1 MarR family transcriptional regulator [Litoribacterium kuwaitense]
MDSIERSLKLLIVLSRAHRSVHDSLQKNIADKGLNLSEFAVLELLYHKGEHSIQKIGDRILVSSGSMTYIVNKLAKKGYVHRRQCTEDRRVYYASITEIGSALMDEYFPYHAKQIENMFSVLDSREQQYLIEALKKIGLSAQLD